MHKIGHAIVCMTTKVHWIGIPNIVHIMLGTGYQIIGRIKKEGEHLLSNVAGSFLLVVLFSTKVQIGLVRLFTGQAIKNLVPLAAEFEKAQKSQEGSVVDEGFGQALTTEIESLFGEN